MNVHEYHQRNVEERKEREETGERSAGSKREPTVSRSKLAAMTYSGIRTAHKEDEKAKARNLRMMERERLENIKKMQDDNIEKYRRAFKKRDENTQPPGEPVVHPAVDPETPQAEENAPVWRRP